MGYVLGILGALAGAAGALSLLLLHSLQTALLFWIITAVLFTGEAIVGAINRLRIERKP